MNHLHTFQTLKKKKKSSRIFRLIFLSVAETQLSGISCTLTVISIDSLSVSSSYRILETRYYLEESVKKKNDETDSRFWHLLPSIFSHSFTCEPFCFAVCVWRVHCCWLTGKSNLSPSVCLRVCVCGYFEVTARQRPKQPFLLWNRRHLYELIDRIKLHCGGISSSYVLIRM